MRLLRTIFFVTLVAVSGLVWLMVSESGEPEPSKFEKPIPERLATIAKPQVTKSDKLEPEKTESNTFSVVVNFSGTELDEGLIIAGLFDSARNFGKRELPLQRCETTTTSQGNAVCEFTNLPPGHYAISAFQDSNGNSELDKNGFGRPKEKYGFSNNARGRFGPPKYRECRFEVSDASVLEIELR